MKQPRPRTIHLKDYRPPSHLVETVHLDIVLDASRTRVRSKLRITPNPAAVSPTSELKLDGELFDVESLSLDGRLMTPGSWTKTTSGVTLNALPDRTIVFEAVTLVDPDSNKALQGLYRSKGIFCTQCEAEGFRRITYMLDRPDVLAIYTVRLEADVEAAPVLLANGNQVERGTLGAGRHYAIWHDPHPKPSYLFAVVAGDLGSIASDFTTMSGRKVDLRIYVEHGKEPRAAWAMDALKRAMRWDETRFGREYDLSQFNIVAVSDFNMGAMENKGLNIFNDRLVLASAESATDAQFEAIESVVAHEYFHNWTGNRITCRDWFQLCLKEGLTVYRDQEFSSDERSATVQRIADVRQLKALQFPEDAGPLAHAVRPESYIEINNFYTATVYEKGAELVRMLHTLLGAETFQRGMDLYFHRHDGMAATIEDFLACFEKCSGQSLAQFQRWYSQPGTPGLDCQIVHDPKRATLTITLAQIAPGLPRATQKAAAPLTIPVRIGLVDPTGRDQPLRAADGTKLSGDVIVLDQARASYTFTGVPERPIVSMLRGFSAPVNLTVDHSDGDLAFLAVHDSDLFNRWQASQLLGMRTLLHIYRALKSGKRSTRGTPYAATLARALANTSLDPAYRAELLRLPSVLDLMREAGVDVDPALAMRAHRVLSRRVATHLGLDIEKSYRSLRPSGPFSPDAKSAGHRALRTTLLTLLSARGLPGDKKRIAEHYFAARTMTDQAHALALLAHETPDVSAKAFDHFRDRWQADDLVIDIWFSAQAQSSRASALKDVTKLLSHPLFKITTPNKVRALIATFATANPLNFHRPDGAGYEFVADQVLVIDGFNPQVASRLASSLRSWRGLEPVRRMAARKAIDRVASAPGLSRDVFEVISKMRDD